MMFSSAVNEILDVNDIRNARSVPENKFYRKVDHKELLKIIRHRLDSVYLAYALIRQKERVDTVWANSCYELLEFMGDCARLGCVQFRMDKICFLRGQVLVGLNPELLLAEFCNLMDIYSLNVYEGIRNYRAIAGTTPYDIAEYTKAFIADNQETSEDELVVMDIFVTTDVGHIASKLIGKRKNGEFIQTAIVPKLDYLMVRTGSVYAIRGASVYVTKLIFPHNMNMKSNEWRYGAEGETHIGLTDIPEYYKTVFNSLNAFISLIKYEMRDMLLKMNKSVVDVFDFIEIDLSEKEKAFNAIVMEAFINKEDKMEAFFHLLINAQRQYDDVIHNNESRLLFMVMRTITALIIREEVINNLARKKHELFTAEHGCDCMSGIIEFIDTMSGDSQSSLIQEIEDEIIEAYNSSIRPLLARIHNVRAPDYVKNLLRKGENGETINLYEHEEEVYDQYVNGVNCLMSAHLFVERPPRKILDGRIIRSREFTKEALSTTIENRKELMGGIIDIETPETIVESQDPRSPKRGRLVEVFASQASSSSMSVVTQAETLMQQRINKLCGDDNEPYFWKSGEVWHIYDCITEKTYDCRFVSQHIIGVHSRQTQMRIDARIKREDEEWKKKEEEAKREVEKKEEEAKREAEKKEKEAKRESRKKKK